MGRCIMCGQNGHYCSSHRLNNGEDKKACNEVVTHHTSCSLLVLGYITPQYLNTLYCGMLYFLLHRIHGIMGTKN